MRLGSKARGAVGEGLTFRHRYELAPHASMTEMADQVAAAVLFLHGAHPARRLVVMGHSAGGHLAALMLFRADAAPCIAACVALSGLFDLGGVQRCYANEAIKLTDAEVAVLSPARLVVAAATAAARPPILLAIAQHEPDAFRQESVAFRTALSAAGGGPVTWVDQADRDHFDLVERLRFADDPVTAAIVAFVGL